MIAISASSARKKVGTFQKESSVRSRGGDGEDMSCPVNSVVPPSKEKNYPERDAKTSLPVIGTVKMFFIRVARAEMSTPILAKKTTSFPITVHFLKSNDNNDTQNRFLIFCKQKIFQFFFSANL